MAKLRWTLEMSRLAFFRSNQQAEIRFVIQRNESLAVSDWNFEQDRITLIDYDIKKNLLTLHKFPPLSKN